MSGIHHVTLVTRHAQENFDFYTDFLKLRLVKQTGGFEDALQLHLFYGDATGSPGSLITFLVWEDGAPGRTGHGQITELAFAIPRDSIGSWLTRALTASIPFSGPRLEFGEPVLRLTDPDGIAIKLVGSKIDGAHPSADAAIDAADAIRRIRGVQILSEHAAATADFLERHFSYRRTTREDGLLRMVSAAGDSIDIRDAAGFWPGVAGTGMIDHIAFRQSEPGDLDALVARLQSEGLDVTPRKDRVYFQSAYVREPGGALLEAATDGPGMLIDEALEELGETVFIPAGTTERQSAIRLMLPSIARPGQARDGRVELPFIHRIWRSPDPDGSVMILLHGQGGSETDLMPLAHEASPRSDLIGFRGRSTEDASLRWFRPAGPAGFDRNEITREAEAFAATLTEALRFYGHEAGTATLLGYSNGANFAAAFLALQPGQIRRAVLLRPLLVLDPPPAADLRGTSVCVIAGGKDVTADPAPLVAQLERAAATVTLIRLDEAAHGLVPNEAVIIQAWLG